MLELDGLRPWFGLCPVFMGVARTKGIAQIKNGKFTAGRSPASHPAAKPQPESQITFCAKLLRGAMAANWGLQRRQHLESRLQKYIVEPSSYRLSLCWAAAMDSAKRRGQPISAADAWIAATALHLAVPLISHNRTHFVGVDGLTVISESGS
jgi:predicted nucleic acid-binding protein